jgi:hypothetical protein
VLKLTWDSGKWASRHTHKRGSDECGHHRMLQESSKKCSDKWTLRNNCREVAKGMGPNKKGRNYKEYFLVVADRLNMKINITHNFTSMVTRHRNIRSYLHWFKILDTPTCPCGTKDQIIDHLLYECELLNKRRDSLISTVLETYIWPISKNTLIKKHFKIFINLLRKSLLIYLTKCQIHHTKQIKLT